MMAKICLFYVCNNLNGKKRFCTMMINHHAIIAEYVGGSWPTRYIYIHDEYIFSIVWRAHKISDFRRKAFLLDEPSRDGKSHVTLIEGIMSARRMEGDNKKASTFQNDEDIIALNQSLLNAIVRGDYDTYSLLCSDDMTCFEPEASDCLVKGKTFHKFYFDLPNKHEWGKPHVVTNVTMCDVHMRRIGKDVAIVSYVRLNQTYNEGKATTTKTCETRVWERRDHEWRNVHLHRS